MVEQTAAGKKPTIVLVHGAFADASSWEGVIVRLLAAGYEVVATANPLRGPEEDAAQIASVVDAVDGPVVLVGHSIGGFAVTNAAAGRDDVQALVYVAGFAPEVGESAGQISDRFPGSSLGDAVSPVALADGGTDLYIAQEVYRHQFAEDVPATVTRVMAVSQRPVAASDLDAPSGEPGWRTIPSWFLFGDADRNIPVAAHRWMAERAGSRGTVEIAGASHAVGVSHADEVVELILVAVAETSQVVVA